MLILIILVLVILAILLAVLSFRLLKWTLKSKRRVQVGLMVLVMGVFTIGINHFFFKNMRFIQSEVYPNLYLVKYPDKSYNLVQKAIQEKIKEHLKTEHETGKPLAYTDENGIYFYELGGRTFGFIGDAGTSYFLDHEEDLGGFVSEELGMYTDYRLAEFYYEPCKTDSTLLCGAIDYFKEGEFFKVDSLVDLVSHKAFDRPSVAQAKQAKTDTILPIHGPLELEQLNKYYPNVLDDLDHLGGLHAKKVPLPTKNGEIVSILRHTIIFQDIFLCTHDKNLNLIDAFYIGKATDFDNGKSQTIDYKMHPDSTITFNKVVWGIAEQNQEETIDTLAHETVLLHVNQKGGLAYDIKKSPKHYVLEVYDADSDPSGINLRDKPNGNIIKTLERPEYGYTFSIVRGENEWFRVLKIDDVEDGEIEMPQGILWIHSSVIGIRANWDAPIFDSPNTGKQIGIIPADTDLKIIDLKQDWVKIEHHGTVGWVAAAMLCGNPVTTCP